MAVGRFRASGGGGLGELACMAVRLSSHLHDAFGGGRCGAAVVARRRVGPWIGGGLEEEELTRVESLQEGYACRYLQEGYACRYLFGGHGLAISESTICHREWPSPNHQASMHASVSLFACGVHAGSCRMLLLLSCQPLLTTGEQLALMRVDQSACT